MSVMWLPMVLQLASASLMVAGGEVVVVVFGDDGAPAAGYVVKACSNDDANVCKEAVTTSSGSARLLLPGNDATVTVTPPEGQAWSWPKVPLAETPTDILIDWSDGDVDAEINGVAPSVEVEDAPAATTSTTKSAQVMSTLSGQVTSMTTQKPVVGARVIVRGGASTTTDESGRFQLPAAVGTVGLSVVHPEFTAEVHEGIAVVDGGASTFDVQLTPAAVELDALVVTAPHVAGSLASTFDQRKNSKDITEVLGAEQMSKAGDSDAAGALRRVTGVTIVGGRYVYVRGLGERYSATLLNGAGLPSPEPERRVVPLDLFPTSVLQGVVVHKTFSPKLPGEFGGGSVELLTRGYPEEFLLKFGLSTGMTLGQTFTMPNMGPSFITDATGVDFGGRALPTEVRDASAEGKLLQRDQFSDRGYTADELEAFGESMPDTWKMTPQMLLPNFGFSGEMGDRFKFGKWELGYLGAVNYGRDDTRRTYRRNYLVQGAEGLEIGHAYDFDVATRNVQLGGLGTLGLRYGDDHEVTLTSLLGRITDDESRVYQGENRDVGSDIRVSRMRWVERTLLSEQLRGHHAFGLFDMLGVDMMGLDDVELDWRYTYSLALRHEPDRREVRYDNEPGTDRWLLSDRPEGNQRLFSDLTDHHHDVGLSLSVPFNQWNGLDAKMSVGIDGKVQTRTVDTRRYKYLHKGERSRLSEVLGRQPQDIFTEQNIGTDGFQFEEITRQTDNYEAQQLIGATWAQLQLPLWTFVDVSGGVRVEHSSQTVSTFELFNPDQTPVMATLSTTDVLPAMTATVGLPLDMQLRFAGSMTVSRPDFRELSPATFNDVTGGRQVFGNPDLERALIASADARWEWYPKAGTSLSTAVFYKHFDKPIEQVVVLSAQQSITYANADFADNIGAEIEGRVEGDVVHPWLDGFFIGGNATLTWSQVSLGDDSGIQTSSSRPLQGQSPWVVNAQGGYSNEDWGTDVSMLYNVFGPRITSVGAQGAPDVFEQPFHQFDVVVKQRLPWGLSLGVKAKNLIDLPATFTQGDVTLAEIHRGRSFSASLGYTF